MHLNAYMSLQTNKYCYMFEKLKNLSEKLKILIWLFFKTKYFLLIFSFKIEMAIPVGEGGGQIYKLGEGTTKWPVRGGKGELRG